MQKPIIEYQNEGFDTLEFLLGMFTLLKAQEALPIEQQFNPFDENHPITITVLPMKTPYYTYDQFLDTLAGSLAFFFLLTFFTPMY